MSENRERLARWLRGDGIEIGALHRPLKVPESARVRYVDRLPETELRKHYPELDGQSLAPVSSLGSAEDLYLIEDGSLDFVIANHLLEHLEYPVRGLAEFHRVLKAGGLVYMALPDQRQTFDRDRRLTPVEHLLEEYRSGNAERNRRAHYMDWVLHVNGTPPGLEAEAETNRLLEMGYSIHFHVWTPDTFLDFFVAARREAGLAFSLLGFSAPQDESDDEFILLLAKGLPTRPRLPPPPASVPQERQTGLKAAPGLQSAAIIRPQDTTRPSAARDQADLQTPHQQSVMAPVSKDERRHDACPTPGHKLSRDRASSVLVKLGAHQPRAIQEGRPTVHNSLFVA